MPRNACCIEVSILDPKITITIWKSRTFTHPTNARSRPSKTRMIRPNDPIRRLHNFFRVLCSFTHLENLKSTYTPNHPETSVSYVEASHFLCPKAMEFPITIISWWHPATINTPPVIIRSRDQNPFIERYSRRIIRMLEEYTVAVLKKIEHKVLGTNSLGHRSND